MRRAAGVLLLAALPALAAEVTVMRPKGLIAQDFGVETEARAA